MRRMSLLLPALLLFVAGIGSAVDGVLEINQACAAGPGCFSGDAGGFPVTITAPGSYALTSDLSVTDANTSALDVDTADVSIDLRGFALSGPVVCTGQGPSISCGAGNGLGVDATIDISNRHPRIRVVDGRISGFGSFGIHAGAQSRIRGITVTGNGGPGVRVEDGSVITESAADRNGSLGLQTGGGGLISRCTATFNGTDGLRAGAVASVLDSVARANGNWGIFIDAYGTAQRNTVAGNDSDGIRAGTRALVADSQISANGGEGVLFTVNGFVSGNTISDNTLWGVRFNLTDDTGAYRENLFDNNPSGTVSGGVDAGGNVCDGTTTCP